MRFVVAAAAVVLAAGCGGSQRHVTSNGAVTVDGRRLVVHCSGSGSPTVVLEAGLGLSSSTWAEIQPLVARTTRVCAYDRLGEGESDKPASVQSVEDQAKTLDALIQAAGWKGPFIFVGHSWGGAVVQQFAADHTEAVAGMVLVDASLGDQLQRWLGMIPPKPKRGLDLYGPIRESLRQALDPRQNPEELDWGASADDLRHVTTLGKIPLVVLTAGTLGLEFPTMPSQDRAYAIWVDLHKRLARLSSNSVYAVAQYSGHFIYQSQPDVVMASIRAVVRAARDHGELPRCQALFHGLDAVGCH